MSVIHIPSPLSEEGWKGVIIYPTFMGGVMRTLKMMTALLPVSLLAFILLLIKPAGATIFSFGPQGKDEVVCYLLSENENASLTLNMKQHSPLNLGHKKGRDGRRPARQITYTAVGKYMEESEVSSVYGMALAAKGKGARLAFTSTNLLGGEGVFFAECGSEETSATPKRWECKFEFNNGPGGDLLFERVDPRTASEEVLTRCEFFPEFEGD
jgi:hypothetical protein